MAQLAEQLICNQQVIGSSPIIGFEFYIAAGWSSLEARRAHNPKVIGSNPIPATYAQIAQLVEQRTENPRVAGSIPALGICIRNYTNTTIIYGALAQSVEHLTFNQVVRGSNPRCFILRRTSERCSSFFYSGVLYGEAGCIYFYYQSFTWEVRTP